MVLTLLHKNGRISLNNGPIWKIQKLTGSWEQGRPAGRIRSIISPPTCYFIRLGREDGIYLEHWSQGRSKSIPSVIYIVYGSLFMYKFWPMILVLCFEQGRSMWWEDTHRVQCASPRRRRSGNNLHPPNRNMATLRLSSGTVRLWVKGQGHHVKNCDVQAICTVIWHVALKSKADCKGHKGQGERSLSSKSKFKVKGQCHHVKKHVFQWLSMVYLTCDLSVEVTIAKVKGNTSQG